MTVDNIVRVLLCILAALLAFTFANIYAAQYIKLNDWGVWANWVIALCNIVMAISAAYVIFKAASWFTDKINNKAVDYAFELLLKFDDARIKLDLLHNDLIIHTSFQSGMFENKDQNLDSFPLNLSLEFDQKELLKIEKKLTKFYKVSTMFIRSLNNTKRLGFEMKPEIQNHAKEIFRDYYNTAMEHLIYYKSPQQYIALTIKTKLSKDKTKELESRKKQLDSLAKKLESKIAESFDFN
ncbi:hypothetical protein CA266_22465 [Serratia marcescens]|uniref:hypothetical protein n=1 Tax=Serratia marcescens TaxID=615 RepID=UPI00187FD72C|nr:hypothetical protein [Serratia marcescens]QOV53624.1 hypothetical protein CA266_22465 [Serratia marcescens]